MSPVQKPIANAPFNDIAGADIILCSKDGVDFYIHKLLLSLASPFFQQMFTLPQPSKNIQTIEVTEDSQTLDRLLRLCYPVPDPIFEDLSDTSDVLEAAMKYEMDEATAIMGAAIVTFVKEKPLQVYATACRLMLEKEAKLAAGLWQAACPKVFSKPNGSGAFPDWNTTSAAVSYPPEMADISAGAYFRLLRFIHDETDSNFVNADLRDKQEAPATTVMPILRPINFEDADIILRSLDGVEFHVHKVIISLISPGLLVNEPSKVDDLPVFDVPENGRILAMLLELCYPNGNPDAITLESLDVRAAVLQAAQKYKCSKAILLLKKYYRNDIKKDPLRVYFTAVQHGWKEEAEEAALYAASKPIEDVYVPEMESVSANIYHSLLKFCHSLRSIVVNLSCRYRDGQVPVTQQSTYFWNKDTPRWWYLDPQNTSNLPAWVAAPIIAGFGRYAQDVRSMIYECGKLTEEELSKVSYTYLLLDNETNPFQIKLEIDCGRPHAFKRTSPARG
jgi:hypothetical protein